MILTDPNESNPLHQDYPDNPLPQLSFSNERPLVPHKEAITPIRLNKCQLTHFTMWNVIVVSVLPGKCGDLFAYSEGILSQIPNLNPPYHFNMFHLGEAPGGRRGFMHAPVGKGCPPSVMLIFFLSISSESSRGYTIKCVISNGLDGSPRSFTCFCFQERQDLHQKP